MRNSKPGLLRSPPWPPKRRLALTLGTDIRGSTSADAAFAFALAGIKDKELYQTLAFIACQELRRVGQRPSFRSKYVLTIVEKLAAAGLKGEEVRWLHQCAADCLDFKQEHHEAVEILRSQNVFDLLSPHPLLWIWRYASKQTKVSPSDRSEESQQQKKTEGAIVWENRFGNPNKPLILDIGCGMGVSLLGLATLDNVDKSFENSDEGKLIEANRWLDGNFLGCDLSAKAIRYAQSIAERWNISNHVDFVCMSAFDILDQLSSSQERVALAMIQFPTPYKLTSSDGNSQLPQNEEDGFMASKELLGRLRHLLKSSGGLLLIQSNCEDVAVAMLNMAKEVGFQDVVVPSPNEGAEDEQEEGGRVPQRTIAWVQKGGARARGQSWSSKPLLPPRAATETEVACAMKGTPVHRCLLRPC